MNRGLAVAFLFSVLIWVGVLWLFGVIECIPC